MIGNICSRVNFLLNRLSEPKACQVNSIRYCSLQDKMDKWLIYLLGRRFLFWMDLASDAATMHMHRSCNCLLRPPLSADITIWYKQTVTWKCIPCSYDGNMMCSYQHDMINHWYAPLEWCSFFLFIHFMFALVRIFLQCVSVCLLFEPLALLVRIHIDCVYFKIHTEFFMLCYNIHTTTLFDFQYIIWCVTWKIYRECCKNRNSHCPLKQCHSFSALLYSHFFASISFLSNTQQNFDAFVFRSFFLLSV